MTGLICEKKIEYNTIIQKFDGLTEKNTLKSLMVRAAGVGAFLVATSYLKLPDDDKAHFLAPIQFAINILVYSYLAIPLAIKSYDAAANLTEITLDHAQRGWSGLYQIFKKNLDGQSSNEKIN